MPNVGVFGAVFVTATALLVSASSVEAQRLAVGYSVFLNPTTLEVVNLGTGLVESREQKSFSGPALFSSDGRFVVLSVFSPTSPSLEVRDLVTGFGHSSRHRCDHSARIRVDSLFTAWSPASSRGWLRRVCGHTTRAGGTGINFGTYSGRFTPCGLVRFRDYRIAR